MEPMTESSEPSLGLGARKLHVASRLASAKPTVSVLLCAYSSARWPLLCEAIGSVRAQTRLPEEVLLVVDHNPDLLARARAEFPDVRCLENQAARGLSGARNTGVQHATGDVVAFLDDDARANPDWLAAIVAEYADPGVVGTGGPVDSDWSEARPRWFPREFEWVVGCSYQGSATATVAIRNPIGANMSFRREAFGAGGFNADLGRIGRTPLGCEETEFAIRAQAETGGTILHVAGARVEHLVTPERATWRYFYSRCWAEGLSKASVAVVAGSFDALSSERAYVAHVLPGGVARGLGEAARGDASGILRSSAIVAGLALTAAGYAWGRAGARLRRR